MSATALQGIGSPALWIGFSVFVVAALVLDFVVFHREAKLVSIRQALAWVALWVTVALAAMVGLRVSYGAEPSLQFLAGYLLEYALSVDNLFVFLIIFTYFAVPGTAKDRVLFLGILGSILLRGVFILVGSALVHRFHWTLYLFGAFLVFTGLKLLFQKGDEEVAVEKSPVIRLFRRLVPMVSSYRGDKFFVKEGDRWHATPLMLVVAVVGFTDVIFATDSIPAIFGVTEDPFVIYSSNIFAVLGLRALFFVLSHLMTKFHLLKFGIALILSFIGVKMLIADLYLLPVAESIGITQPLKISIGVALGVVAGLLGLSVLGSALFPQKQEPGAAEPSESRPNNNH
jgi:tellurite resistance protein TerC